MLEVARLLLDVLEHAAPEVALGVARRAAKATSTGRVILPSRKSSPTVLPSSAWSAAVVQRVVDQLEGDAEIVAVGRQRRLLGGRALGRPPRRPRQAAANSAAVLAEITSR